GRGGGGRGMAGPWTGRPTTSRAPAGRWPGGSCSTSFGPGSRTRSGPSPACGRTGSRGRISPAGSAAPPRAGGCSWQGPSSGSNGNSGWGAAMADSTDPADRYSVLWHSGNRPDLDAFLASAGPLSARQLADLVCTDQRERWRAGDRVRVEAYFQRFPRLRSDPALALDLVYAEVLMREGDGSAADAALSARFPDLAPALPVQVDL